VPDDKQDAIQQLKKQFWETMSKAEALRNIAATQHGEEDAARFIRRAEAEEDRAKGFLREAEILEKSGREER
jgi:hypothetical protein